MQWACLFEQHRELNHSQEAKGASSTAPCEGLEAAGRLGVGWGLLFSRLVPHLVLLHELLECQSLTLEAFLCLVTKCAGVKCRNLWGFGFFFWGWGLLE